VPRFTDDEEAEQWADAWVQRELPTEFLRRITDNEAEHLRWFEGEYGRFVTQAEAEYAALATLIDGLNGVERSAWPAHRSIQYVLIAYNLKSFQSALDRIAKGYYEDGITLTRGLYETFVRCLFVSCYPDDGYSALVFIPPKGVRRFNLTSFLRDNLGFEWDAKYGVMSRFAHSNSHHVALALKRALDREGDPESFGMKVAPDASMAEAAIPFFQFVLLAHIRFVVERLLDGVAPGALDDSTASESVDLLTYALVNHPKEYWRMVAGDLDLLFAMLKVADRREDWHAFLSFMRGD